MMELVTGGSGSGKSAYAESAVCRLHRLLCRKTGERTPLYYIADMVPYGRETEEKIANHRRMRAGKGFRTLEWYQDLSGKLIQEMRCTWKAAPGSALWKLWCAAWDC